jgi:NTP pyrophosphatase (non-canonical NTP hydrolase)
MLGNEYQELAMRTNDGLSELRLEQALRAEEEIYQNGVNIGEVIMGCLGISGESGEFNDMIKKWIFHKKPIDLEHLKKELGDVLWYVALICNGCEWSMDDIMQKNVDKLKARYPEGFSIEKANNRKEGDI